MMDVVQTAKLSNFIIYLNFITYLKVAIRIISKYFIGVYRTNVVVLRVLHVFVFFAVTVPMVLLSENANRYRTVLALV